MVFKSIIRTLCACLTVVSFNASAAIVSVDWQIAGDNLVTRDTTNRLEWLDLTATVSRSYVDISSKLGAEQEFDGWRYASMAEIGGFYDAFGGDSNFYNGFSTQNNGLFDAVAPYWGDTYCEAHACETGEGYSYAISSDQVYEEWFEDPIRYATSIFDYSLHIYSPEQDKVDVYKITQGDDFTSNLFGSALVRDISPVPIPSAVWLFGSGLIGLVGLARRKKRNN